MPHELVFALPARSAEVSGGNLYNQKLIRALSRLTPVATLTVAECRVRVERGQAGFYFIDTLDLAEFASFPAARAGQHFGLIVHHLPSLEPGIDPTDPALAVERTTLARFDAYLATSSFTAEFLRARGIAAEQIWTVPPAPPADAAELPSPAPPFVFAMVGNLIPRKGVLELLECLAREVAETDAFRLELAGRSDVDPAYAHACLALANSAKLQSKVRYLGPVPNERIAECYRRAAALVSASKMETFGMALQEARAFGLPILAVSGGYTREHLAHEGAGLLFESIPALARELLALTRESSRLQALFESARHARPASGYTWKKAAEILSSVLHRYSPPNRA